jgi:hypothetical protein
MTTFRPRMLLLTLKQKDLVNKIYLKNCAKYGRDPDPESKLKFTKVGTGTGINSFGSTTMNTIVNTGSAHPFSSPPSGDLGGGGGLDHLPFQHVAPDNEARLPLLRPVLPHLVDPIIPGQQSTVTATLTIRKILMRNRCFHEFRT